MSKLFFAIFLIAIFGNAVTGITNDAVAFTAGIKSFLDDARGLDSSGCWDVQGYTAFNTGGCAGKNDVFFGTATTWQDCRLECTDKDGNQKLGNRGACVSFEMTKIATKWTDTRFPCANHTCYKCLASSECVASDGNNPNNDWCLYVKDEYVP